MSDTPKLGIPEVSTGQANAEGAVNLQARFFEVLRAGVLNRTLKDPPGSPSDGDAHVVKDDTPTADWATHANDIAFLSGTQWKYVEMTAALAGLRIPCAAEDTDLEWTGTVWVAVDGVQTLTDAVTVTWDAQWGRHSILTPTDNRTIGTPTNLVAGRVYSVRIKQDPTGSRLITWPALVKWAGGSAPTLTTTGGRVDAFSFLYDGTDLLELSRTLDLTPT